MILSRIIACASLRPKRGAQASDLWWSALLQLDGGTVAALDAALGAAFAGRYVIPAEHLEDAADPDLSDPDLSDPDLIVTIYAKPDVMTALNLSGNDYGVKTVDLGAQVSDATVTAGSALPDPEDEIAPASLKVKVVDPGTVTVAVIDDGIAFGHNLFRDGLTSSRGGRDVHHGRAQAQRQRSRAQVQPQADQRLVAQAHPQRAVG